MWVTDFNFGAISVRRYAIVQEDCVITEKRKLVETSVSREWKRKWNQGFLKNVIQEMIKLTITAWRLKEECFLLQR